MSRQIFFEYHSTNFLYHHLNVFLISVLNILFPHICIFLLAYLHASILHAYILNHSSYKTSIQQSKQHAFFFHTTHTCSLQHTYIHITYILQAHTIQQNMKMKKITNRRTYHIREPIGLSHKFR